MDTSTLGFALAAGLVAAVNPCGFAMLPSYLTLVVLGNGDECRRATAVLRAAIATAAMAAGFLVVFATFGLVVTPLTSQVQRYLPILTIVIGVVLVALGAWLLAGRTIPFLLPKPRRGAPSTGLGSMFGYGIAYAVASLSCALAPFLAVTGATFRSGSLVEGTVAYLAYAAGMALVVGVLAVGIALAGAEVAGRARNVLPYVNRIGGGLLVLVGLYVGYYGVYEVRLYFGEGAARDPVIDAVREVQEAAVNWIDGIGAVPFVIIVITLAVIMLGAVLWRRRVRQ